jgi:hypothetical protein
MSKKSVPVVERSRNDIDNQLLITSTPLSDRAFWTSSYIFIFCCYNYLKKQSTFQ